MRSLMRLCTSTKGAVAPTVALSLIALLVVGGVAFDYARLASMDTELQDAADQAALAAAGQLDGDTGACLRAAKAASTLIANNTRFANDDPGNIKIDVANEATCDRTGNIKFYAKKDKSDSANPTDATAAFVEVTVGARTAYYAMTPIVAALSSGAKNATAYAGVGSAVCGVVPFFICNPVETDSNTDPDLSPGGVTPGTGLVMAQGGTQWGPGNFGFIDQLGNGANGVAEALASDSLNGNCAGTDNVTTETGNILNAVRDSLNMRFDFKPGNNSACKKAPCSPSTNVIKDVVRPATGCSWASYDAGTSTQMASTTPPKYFPTANAPLGSTTTPQTMGHPRDICHYFKTAAGTYPLCSLGRVGDGVWDRAAYFRANHAGLDWQNTAGLGANVTRYQTYLWEAQDTARLPTNAIAGTNPVLSAYGQPQQLCLSPGLAPDPAGIDRRRITAAVVNCKTVSKTTGLNGKKTIPVAGFIDVFIVEPSIARTKCTGCSVVAGGTTYDNAYASINDIYTEVIGASGSGEGGQAGQITRRDVPYLIE